MIRVSIVWTETAKKHLASFPFQARKGILDKADRLLESDNPESLMKPLIGPLKGYFSMRSGRYRAICKVERDQLANGDVITKITIRFVIAGIRRDRERKDVYRLAQHLLDLGLLDIEDEEEEESD